MASSNLKIDNGVVKDDLNCVKCQSVPNDACLVPCGCRLCRVCIDDLMASGVEFCPGPSEECGGSPLSQSVTDYRANRNISKLPTKCPNNGCVHACQLANMEEHLRVCPRKSVECPFRELGCTQDKMAAEEMSDHLQRESLSHNGILIGMINNVNNEMEGSKREFEILNRIMADIEYLNNANEINICNIDLLNNKCMCVNYKIEILEEADEHNKAEIEVLNGRDKCNIGEIEVLKKAYICHKNKIDILEKTVESNRIEINMLKRAEADNKTEIEVLKCDLQLKNDQIKSIMDEIKSMKRKENKECTNQMKTLLAETKCDIDLSRVTFNAKVIEYVDKEITEIKRDIQSINQGTQSIKTDIDSIKSQIKVPTDDTLTETVLGVLISALEKQKGQHGTGRDGDRNVPENNTKVTVSRDTWVNISQTKGRFLPSYEAQVSPRSPFR